jgi:magnesium transporter
MPRLTKRRSHKAGLPPGALVHIGERRRAQTRINLVRYNTAIFEEQEVTDLAECFMRPAGTVTWVNVDGLHDTVLLDALGRGFGLHPLVIEDILNTDQRPKVEDHGDYLYIVVKLLSWREPDSGLVTEQVSLVLGPDFVLSFQEGSHDDFEPVRARLRDGHVRARQPEADYLAYMLLDTVVDNYFLALEKFDDLVDSLETELVARPQRATLATLHRLRREMVFLLRAVWPLREVVGLLERGEFAQIRPGTRLYLRDVYDHVIHAIDTVETLRELLAGMLEIYLTSITNRSNEVIKVLTLISTIFLPITFITGWYGMNFRHMPELDWPWAYPLTLLATLAVAITMLAYFKRKKWL